MSNASPKKLSDYLPPLKDQGMDYLAGAVGPGVTVQAKQITQVGAAPLVVDLEAEEGLGPMADANYVVICQGQTAGRVTVDQATITETGFNVLGGAAAEVIHVLIVGRAANQAA